MNKHTPGEWIVELSVTGIKGSLDIKVRDGQRFIATVNPTKYAFAGMWGPKDAVADARIIAAAPELAGALAAAVQELLPYAHEEEDSIEGPGVGSIRSVVDRARAALKKAGVL